MVVVQGSTCTARAGAAGNVKCGQHVTQRKNAVAGQPRHALHQCTRVTRLAGRRPAHNACDALGVGVADGILVGSLADLGHRVAHRAGPGAERVACCRGVSPQCASRKVKEVGCSFEKADDRSQHPHRLGVLKCWVQASSGSHQPASNMGLAGQLPLSTGALHASSPSDGVVALQTPDTHLSVALLPHCMPSFVDLQTGGLALMSHCKTRWGCRQLICSTGYLASRENYHTANCSVPAHSNCAHYLQL